MSIDTKKEIERASFLLNGAGDHLSWIYAEMGAKTKNYEVVKSALGSLQDAISKLNAIK
jgi:hypothetical protein